VAELLGSNIAPTGGATGTHRNGNSASITSTSVEESHSVSSVTNAVKENGPSTPEPDLDLEIQHLQTLLDFLEVEFESIKQKAEALLLTNHVTFELLWYFLPEGSEISFVDVHSGLTCAGKIFPVVTIDTSR